MTMKTRRGSVDIRGVAIWAINGRPFVKREKAVDLSLAVSCLTSQGEEAQPLPRLLSQSIRSEWMTFQRATSGYWSQSQPERNDAMPEESPRVSVANSVS